MPPQRRSSPQGQDNGTRPRGPEKKFGPYPGGIGIAVWLNTAIADDGAVRRIRSVTISPRRYQDRETGEWKDAVSYKSGDLPALIYALQRALDYVATTPIPGDRPDQSHPEDDSP